MTLSYCLIPKARMSVPSLFCFALLCCLKERGKTKFYWVKHPLGDFPPCPASVWICHSPCCGTVQGLPWDKATSPSPGARKDHIQLCRSRWEMLLTWSYSRVHLCQGCLRWVGGLGGLWRGKRGAGLWSRGVEGAAPWSRAGSTTASASWF